MNKTTKRIFTSGATARLKNDWIWQGNQQDFNIVGAKNYGFVDFSVSTQTVDFGAGNRRGGVLLLDGRVLLISSDTSSRLYDPITNTAKNIGTINGCYGGVLMQDGRVFCIPSLSTTAYIFNPINESITSLVGFGNNFRGGVLLQDGRVFCLPFNRTSAIIYNPFDNSTTTINGFSGQGFFGCVLQDGRVMRPIDNGAEIYNPFTNTISIASGTFPPMWGGTVLLPDGKIYCIPYSSSTTQSPTAYIYNPVTNTTIAASGAYPTTLDGFAFGCLTQDGRVLVANLNNTNPRLYDPITDTLTTLNAVGGSYHFGGALQLPNGQVFMLPFSQTYGVIYGNPSVNKLPMGRTHSAFYNKL